MVELLKRGALLVLLVGLLVIFAGCPKEEDNNPAPPAPEPPYESVTVQGMVELPDGIDTDPSELDVVTFAGRADIGGDGGFAVAIVESEGDQLAFIDQPADDDRPVMIGMLNELTDEFDVTIETTVLGMALLNPHLLGTSVVERAEYRDAVLGSQQYTDLVVMLTDLYLEDGIAALDFETNPEFYQALAALMHDTLENLGLVVQTQDLDDAVPPYLEGMGGGVVSLFNPTFVVYGAGIFQNGETWQSTQTMWSRLVDVDMWGWPPQYVEGDMATDVILGDGDYLIAMNRGLDFSNIADWNDPAARATLMNSANILFSIIDLMAGQLPVYPEDEALSEHFSVTPQQIANITVPVSQQDETGTLIGFLDLVKANSDGFALWIWNETEDNATSAYLKAAGTVMQNVALVFKLLSYDHATGPFIYDLVFAPQQVNYMITMQGGELQEGVEENHPPDVFFSVYPPAGIIGTEFTFNAGMTTDDHDPLSDLEFSWDFEGDGIFDVDWTSDTTAAHIYDADGAWKVVCVARDKAGLTNAAGTIVNVGGAAGTATHVKCFRDVLPWSSNAMTNMLESLGFTEGEGPFTYEILPSEMMATASLTPGEDLVIISNDQATSFYMNYAANMARFNNFVYMGGSLFWEACDRGWANGDMGAAGVILPGNVQFEYYYDNYNYIVAPDLPLVAGLPETLDHNYASHEAFSNLALGTTVYCVDSRELATLIEYSLGGGWVLMTGQPLEHQYDYDYGVPDDMSQLLPRIVAYFTGQEPPEAFQNPRRGPAVRTSAGTRGHK